MPSFKIPGKEDRVKQRLRALFLKGIECYCEGDVLCGEHEKLIQTIFWIVRTDEEQVEERVPQSIGNLMSSRYSLACFDYRCGDCTRDSNECICDCHRDPVKKNLYHSQWPYRTGKYGVESDAKHEGPKTGRAVHGSVHRRERKR